MNWREKLATMLRRRKANRAGLPSSVRSQKHRLLFERLEDRKLLATIDLASLGTGGMTIHGADAGDALGFSVNGAGDVNGDGFDDLLIGAYKADSLSNGRIDAGENYVVFGSNGLPATIDLSLLSVDGIDIYGVDVSDFVGFSASSAGDTNGDGFDDMITGAYLANAAGNLKADAGEAYLIFGQNFTSAVTHLGTSASETLTGSSGPDEMVGGQGNDMLIGNGDADVLIGGQGDDVLAVSDLQFQRLLGGSGFDTLRLDGASLKLDLPALANNRLTGIEQIDITGMGNNVLTISYREVINISDESNTLIVRRNAGDAVSNGSGWIQGANETILGSPFAVYTQGRAILKVQIAESHVTNRQIFYHRSTSSIFGDGTENPVNAIDQTKSALLPGQTASIANYTNYSRGLNGLVVDVDILPGTPTASDFLFAIWNGIDASGFVATTEVPIVSVIVGGGSTGSSRIKLEFANNAIQNTWLRVTLLANAITGLATNDVFYFGNAIGDMNAGNVGSPTVVRANATDTSVVRQNQSPSANSVGVSSIHDLNKDGRVNATDTSLVRQNQSNSLILLFTSPPSLLSNLAPQSPMLESSIVNQVFSVPSSSFESLKFLGDGNPILRRKFLR